MSPPATGLWQAACCLRAWKRPMARAAAAADKSLLQPSNTTGVAAAAAAAATPTAHFEKGPRATFRPAPPPEAWVEQEGAHLPEVHFGPGRAMGVQRGLLGLLWLVEPEPVAVAVLGPVKLLYQEDDGIVEEAQHPQPTHTCSREGSRSSTGIARSGLQAQPGCRAGAGCSPRRSGGGGSSSGSTGQGPRRPQPWPGHLLGEWAPGQARPSQGSSGGSPGLCPSACADQNVPLSTHPRRRAASGGRWNGPPALCPSETSRHLEGEGGQASSGGGREGGREEHPRALPTLLDALAPTQPARALWAGKMLPVARSHLQCSLHRSGSRRHWRSRRPAPSWAASPPPGAPCASAPAAART